MDEAMFASIFDDFCEMKRAHIREAAADDRDIPMMVFVSDRPSEEDADAIAVIVPGSRNEIVRALAAVMARMYIPYWAAICSDGFVAKDGDVPEEFLHPGGLIEMALSGSDAVKECLTITAADHAGAKYACSRTYWYDSDGDIWFDDSEGPTGEMNGPMIDILVDITSLWGKTQAEIIAEILSRTTDMN
jgi:hypothetical protein